jgi:hypothetical protein
MSASRLRGRHGTDESAEVVDIPLPLWIRRVAVRNSCSSASVVRWAGNGEEPEAANLLTALLKALKRGMARAPQNTKSPVNTGDLKYRYRDSNPGFRRERAAS